MKKLLMLLTLVFVIAVPVVAAQGTIHLLYTDGEIVEENGNTYFDFDVKAYISIGNEVLACGMAYIEYPTSMFGPTIISNNNVTITKEGILAGEIPNIGIDLYDIYDNDTFSDVFAITFDTPVSGVTSLKPYFAELSSDPQSPSDLLHIRMKLLNYGSGTVVFPAYIPGTDNLYFNFENETFSGGLDISEASEPVVYEDLSLDVEFSYIGAKWLRGRLQIKWTTEYESNVEGLRLYRSINHGAYSLVTTVSANNSSNPTNYYYYDLSANSENIYEYHVEAYDALGNTYATRDVVVNGIFIAYPNPANPSFAVPFELSQAQDVNIKLYDMTGRMVKDIASGTHNAGHYEYHVNCDEFSSGVYLLRTVVDGSPSVQKVLVVK